MSYDQNYTLFNTVKSRKELLLLVVPSMVECVSLDVPGALSVRTPLLNDTGTRELAKSCGPGECAECHHSL